MLTIVEMNRTEWNRISFIFFRISKFRIECVCVLWIRLLRKCLSCSTGRRFLYDFNGFSVSNKKKTQQQIKQIPTYAMKSKAFQNALNHLHNSSGAMCVRFMLLLPFNFFFLFSVSRFVFFFFTRLFLFISHLLRVLSRIRCCCVVLSMK